jgi:hypothetical protein
MLQTDTLTTFLNYNLPKLNFAGINVVAKWFCQRVGLMSLDVSFKTTLRHHLHIRPALHRCQGQCSTQIQHSYWGKSWNQPQGFYTRSQGWHRKKLFNLPQVSNKCWTLWPCIGPKAEKRIPSNLGGQFATLLGANVPAFITILMSMF